jgi:hypothetical protein
MTDTIAIPENCAECYGTDFQINKCPYQVVKEINETLAYFKKEYGLDIEKFGFEKRQLFSQLKPEAEKCKAQIEERARDVIREKERQEQEKRMKHLEDKIEDTQDMLKQLIESQKKVQIFKESEDIDAPVKKVKKPKINYTFHENDDDDEKESKESSEDPDELIPHGGWMKYLRNVKEENISKFLDEKLRKKHPELSDEIDKFLDGEPTEAIKITDNSSGNKMIEYRQMKKRSEIKD